MPVTTRSQSRRGMNMETETEIGPLTLDSQKRIRLKFYHQLLDTILEMLETGRYNREEGYHLSHLMVYSTDEFRSFYDKLRRKNHGLVLYDQCQSASSMFQLEDVIRDMLSEWLMRRVFGDDTDDEEGF
jgi:hypothetical protein